MYKSNNANFDDMGCMWNAWHVIAMMAIRGHGKAREMVMKIEIVYNTTYKTYIKNFPIFDHEKKLD